MIDYREREKEMAEITIHPFAPGHYPAIARIHNSLNISWPEKPRTAEGWAQADKNRNPKSKWGRWVAKREGEVAGFGYFSQGLGDIQRGWAYITVEVHPAHQRRGVGAALYEQVVAGMQALEPGALRADAFTNLPQGFHFLQQRGFYEAFRETPVQLDVTTFDPTPYASLEPRLNKEGILIHTVRELAADPERDRKIYDLYFEVFDDLPQEEPKVVKPPFEEWCQWGLNDPTLLQDAYFIATRGEEYIGLRELYKDPDNNAILGGLLGVQRQFRKQGIGLAMQLRGILYACQNGIPLLKTCTSVQNAPMQALFNKLGYSRGPEWQQCQKNIR
jgi:GNAT superfamily N-acetyltransferase